MNLALDNSDFSLYAADLMPEINFAPLVFADDEDTTGKLALRSIYIGWMTTWNTIMAVGYSVFVISTVLVILFTGILISEDWSWMTVVF